MSDKTISLRVVQLPSACEMRTRLGKIANPHVKALIPLLQESALHNVRAVGVMMMVKMAITTYAGRQRELAKEIQREAPKIVDALVDNASVAQKAKSLILALRIGDMIEEEGEE